MAAPTAALKSGDSQVPQASRRFASRSRKRTPPHALQRATPSSSRRGKRRQQKPCVFEGNARGRVKLQVRLVCLTEQRSGLERPDPVKGLEFQVRTAQQAANDEQARQLRGLKIQFGVLEEESALSRRLAAVPGDPPGGLIHAIAAVQLADSIIAEPGPLANGKGARLVVLSIAARDPGARGPACIDRRILSWSAPSIVQFA